MPPPTLRADRIRGRPEIYRNTQLGSRVLSQWPAESCALGATVPHISGNAPQLVSQVWVPGPPFPGCVTLGQSLNLSEPRFPIFESSWAFVPKWVG